MPWVLFVRSRWHLSDHRQDPAVEPQEFLRTLIDAEITARDESNARTRMKQAAFPVTKRLEEFDVASSSIPPATFSYLASLEWIRAAENTCLIGPAGDQLALGPVGQEHRPGYIDLPQLHRLLALPPHVVLVAAPALAARD